MKFGWYISSPGGRLRAFLKTAAASEIQNISLVVTDSPLPCDLETMIVGHQIKLLVFDYADISGNRMEKNERLSDYLLGALLENSIDYCFSTGSHILAGKLLEVYKNKLINFHPALLPMYRGLKAIDQAVAADEVLLVGNTAHFIDTGIDTGKTIMQSVIPIKAFYDSGRDYSVILDLQVDMLRKLIKIINDGRLLIENDVPSIRGADYSHAEIFPALDF